MLKQLWLRPANSSSPNFYRDTGFDIIRGWLKDNCLCSLNQDFFIHLSPNDNIETIKDSQVHSDEFLAALQRKDTLPFDTVPDISTWLPSLEISGSQLNPENFQQLYRLLILSSSIKKYLTKTNFPLWHVHSRNTRFRTSFTYIIVFINNL